MTRQQGQIRTSRAVAGFAAIVLVTLAIVALCQALLPPRLVDEPPPPAPAAEAGGVLGLPTCPDAEALPPEPIPITSAQVVDCPHVYDGRVVRYEGEVVGAVLSRSRRAWLQLNDDTYGMRLGPLPTHRGTVGANSGLAVSIPLALASELTHVGGFRTHGDGVRVDGVFHRDDPADGGGVTIQATSARIVRTGEDLDHPVQSGRMVVAGVLAAATLALATVTVRSRRR